MSTSPTARQILENAAVLVHLGDEARPGATVIARGVAVTASGAARPPRQLPEEERLASLRRGGDGVAGTLEGDWVEIRPDSPGTATEAMSLCVRIRCPSGRWGAPILSEYDPDGKNRFALHATSSALVFELRTDWRDRPLVMEVPLQTIGTERWHDVVARFAGAYASLHVDGILVDEEWPVGKLPGTGRALVLLGARMDGATVSAGLRAEVDHVALWDRALSDQEILSLSGGVTRAWTLEPPHRGSIQYRRAPAGGYVGDCLPFYHEGTYHFYYLFDRRHHGSKFGLGAHQWAHASSRDLAHWEQHPHAIPITEQFEGSICTGSMFWHDGTWYGFYATRMSDDGSEHVSLATSCDGITFTKTTPNPLASPKPPYKHGPFRDPTVFRDGKTGLFHMLVTAELEKPAVYRRGGCLAHLVSRDLREWTQEQPFLLTGYADQPECSEVFLWRGWYYLFFSHFGLAHYRMSRDPFGPWIKPPVDVIDGPLARVMKSAAFTGDRRIGAFFLAEGGYAGRAVFREFVQHPDGTLGSTWPAEMIPPRGEALHPMFSALTPGAAGDGKHVTIAAATGFGAATLGGIARDFHASFRVTPGPRANRLGVAVHASADGRGEYLQFEPGRRKVGWCRAEDPSFKENELASLYEVDGLDRPFTVELLALEDVLDVCIDGNRTLINRQAPEAGERLLFFCQEGEARFDDITVRPLEGSS